eukprot:COSAG01_NODE_3021_length_6710_cov_7.304644_4_plen_521_part_00
MKNATDALDIVTVLTGNDMGTVRDAIAILHHSAEWDSRKQFATGGRVDADVFRMQKKAQLRVREEAQRAERAARQAEAEKAQRLRAASAAADQQRQAELRVREEAQRAERAARQAEAEKAQRLCAASAAADQQRQAELRVREEAERAERAARQAAAEKAQRLRAASAAADQQRQAELRVREEAQRAERAARQAAAEKARRLSAASAAADQQRQARADAEQLAEQLAGVQVGCGDLIWECEIGDDSWVAFDKEICTRLELGNRAYSSGGAAAPISFTRDGIKYTADFARMTQSRVGTGVERCIRRRVHKPAMVKSTVSCADELRAAPPTLGLHCAVGAVIRKIDEKLAGLGVGPSHPEYNHRFTLFLYTMPTCFKVLNDALRDRSGPRFDAWSPIRWHVDQALSAPSVPSVAADLYRGLDVPNIGAYKTNKRIHWSAFSSATSDPAVAKGFAATSGVVLKLKVYNAKDISRFSWFPQERELLLSPNMEFIVTKERHKSMQGALRGSYVIEMQQIPDATLWS